jgi:hypothetical protein
MGSYIALPEQHRLATEDRVRLSDLKGELFVSGDSLQHPGGDRRVEAFCKKSIIPTSLLMILELEALARSAWRASLQLLLPRCITQLESVCVIYRSASKICSRHRHCRGSKAGAGIDRGPPSNAEESPERAKGNGL